MRFRLPILIIALLAGLVAWHSPESHQTAQIVVRAPVAQNPGDIPDFLTAVELSREAFFAQVQAEIDAYLAAEHERQLAEEAEARRRTETSGARRATVGGTVGECTGFAIPDYIIQRESGGNPSAYNPSGAYGCAQTLLSHYSRGQCVGLDPYTIDGQRECVWRLSNGGTNLNPWAATR